MCVGVCGSWKCLSAEEGVGVCDSHRNVDSAGPTPLSVPQYRSGLHEVSRGQTPEGWGGGHNLNPHPIKNIQRKKKYLHAT